MLLEILKLVLLPAVILVAIYFANKRLRDFIRIKSLRG